MSKIACPYCAAYHEYDTTEMYEEDELYEIECVYCDKIFTVTPIIQIDYKEARADCLNEMADHNYKLKRRSLLRHCYFECSVCGALRHPETSEDWKTIHETFMMPRFKPLFKEQSEVL